MRLVHLILALFFQKAIVMAVVNISVYMDHTEWSATTSMEGLAVEQINKLEGTEQLWAVVTVHEHAGWWLSYARIKGEIRCVGSANDGAHYPEEVIRWWHYRNTLERDVGAVFRSVDRRKDTVR